MKKSRYEYPVPEHQADATLNQANPVSGTQYEVLATTPNARIYGIMVMVTWTVQPTPLEIHVTIDGRSLNFSQVDPVSATPYMAWFSPGRAENLQYLITIAAQNIPAFLLEGRSVRVQVETTGGTVSNLSARVKYARW